MNSFNPADPSPSSSPSKEKDKESLIKAVILIGGPQKGTRFRPLSLDIPKPLFPVAGIPLVQHLIERCVQVPSVKEIFILGYFPADDITPFLAEISPLPQFVGVKIRYLQEYSSLGTAGGIYHFRDQIKAGYPKSNGARNFILINGDVCGNFPLQEMLQFHKNMDNPLITVLGTEATRQQSRNFGCIIEDKNHRIRHYVEKPETFISSLINCGVYVCSLDIFPIMTKIFTQRQENYYCGLNQENEPTLDNENIEAWESIALETDIIRPLCNDQGNIYVYQSNRLWSQVKTAGSAIYANRHYLDLYRTTMKLDRLAKVSPNGPKIIGDVYIHPSAQIHPTCVIGPNVSIGKNAVISAGVRIRESIILGDSTIQEHSLIMYTIIGWNSAIGKWTRIEGTPCDPNPNKPFTKIENLPLFNEEGKLNPSITILGCNVRVPSEVVILNSIVLPHKELSRNFVNEIIL